MKSYLHFLPVIAVTCFGLMIIARTIMLRQRGIRARVHEPGRSWLARFVENLAGRLFWVWLFIVVELTWGPPDWFPRWLAYQLIDSSIAQWIGAVVVVVPVVIYPFALADMGTSWRMGIDRPAHEPAAETGQSSSTLVKHGLFRFARNPIYVLVDMLFVGSFLILGQAVLLVFAILFVSAIHLLVLREEQFLTARYGEQYAAYCRRVRRYGFL